MSVELKFTAAYHATPEVGAAQASKFRLTFNVNGLDFDQNHEFSSPYLSWQPSAGAGAQYAQYIKKVNAGLYIDGELFDYVSFVFLRNNDMRQYIIIHCKNYGTGYRDWLTELNLRFYSPLCNLAGFTQGGVSYLSQVRLGDDFDEPCFIFYNTAFNISGDFEYFKELIESFNTPDLRLEIDGYRHNVDTYGQNLTLFGEDIAIGRRVELDGIFKLSASTVSLKFILDDYSRKFFNAIAAKIDSYPYSFQYVVQILKDDVPKFYGVLNKKSVVISEEREEVAVTLVDFYSDALKNFERGRIQSGRTEYNFESFLAEVFSSFAVSGWPDFPEGLIAGVEASEDGDFQLTYDGVAALPESHYNAVTGAISGLTIENMLIELQKFYCCFFYVDANKKIKAVKRGTASADAAINLNGHIYEEGYERVRTQSSDFNSIIVNASGYWSYLGGGLWDEWSGFALVYGEGDAIKHIIGIESDFSNVPARFYNKFLDLRFQIPFPVFDYVIFPKRSASQRYIDYAPFLLEREVVKCTVDLVNIELFQEVTIDGKSYVVMEAVEYLEEEKTELELLELV